ncbi:MAG TPA: YHS domain-containing protein [Candidatus Nanoarchaeia archaeon]|nr:YHS domain-containing protein [Candidatus Nanoarchaeia archaeon]
MASIDPVCGMKAIERNGVEFNSRIYFFCSDVCRNRFKATPKKFVKE